MVTIWHNVAFDGQGRHTAMLDGYQPGDAMVAVFAYQADPGRPAEGIADEAFAIFNDHPRDAAGAELARAYYGRRLRSLSFPGNRPCCSRSCCFTVVPCCPDLRRGHRPSVCARESRQVQGDRAPMTDKISQRPVPPLDPPEVFAGGEVVAAARCAVDVSTYPRRHVIVVKHAGERQTFSVHEVAHNHVEWVGGQGHYDLGYADALCRMVKKAVG